MVNMTMFCNARRQRFNIVALSLGHHLRNMASLDDVINNNILQFTTQAGF